MSPDESKWLFLLLAFCIAIIGGATALNVLAAIAQVWGGKLGP